MVTDLQQRQADAEADEFAEQLTELLKKHGEGPLVLAIQLARERNEHGIITSYALGFIRACSVLLEKNKLLPEMPKGRLLT